MMSTTHPNVNLVRQFYDLFARGEMHHLKHLFSEDFSFIPAGKRSAIAQPRRGAEEILAFTDEQMKLTSGTWIPRPDDILASNDHAAVLVTVNAVRNGRTVHFRLVHVWTIANGKLTALHSFVDDQYLYDEFFS